MIRLTAAEVAALVGGDVVGDGEAAVTGDVVVDSRLAAPGALFVALPGENVDGHDFAARAVASGASVVLASRRVTADDGATLPSVVVVPDVVEALGALARAVLGRLRRTGELKVVAVTGSVGKTTTKDLLAQVLAASGPTVWPEKSFNNEIGLPLTVLRTDARTRFLVLEMGASGLGHISYLTDIAAPDVAAVLVVGSAHLGEFGGVEAIQRAKSEIVTGLVPGGTAVLNADDPRVRAMAPLSPGSVVLFGEGDRADVRATDVRVDGEGRASFRLVVGSLPEGAADVAPGAAGPAEADVHLRLVGEHHVSNALAAAACCLSLGLTVGEVAERLGEAEALSPHRMQVVERPDGVTVIDDSYNANPDSVRAALKALAVRARAGRRSIAVLGEMLELGDEHVEAHDAVGRLAVRLDIHRLVVVGDGARAMHTGALQEGSWGEESRLLPDVDAAYAWLEEEMRPGDVVLVKSSHGSGLWRLGDLLTGADVAADAGPHGMTELDADDDGRPAGAPR
ncbi:UDP-N-acetylmuramoyl-tripeptide--D-alanyl-D-alanine ligase [Actinotalea sp. Marseille-Q4924]|uniref:UDP-N-acetylmuramoyl-tripeptide--D-alanyl-D- alanine ligase n=1 Tax=Actinotalea sp. Marseille-Q4924 TaxID=2866571 RepID=UPI001CE41059|nr:UDP-N-acetylmuramoyl-tripeptide--D-alanyl-D-alanine ligase [Actinotalea sp. Marseille-Q4924]